MPLTQTHLASMTSMASLRSTVGTVLRATIGPARTRALAARLTPATPPTLAPKSRFRPSEAFVPAPKATVTHYAFLRGIHERLEPRTYVEVGVRHGDSLALSRARSVGIDPAFSITAELQCDVQLVRSTSDEFFARPHAFDFFEGVPVDFAFIDGMHLAEFAFSDFLDVEPAVLRRGRCTTQRCAWAATWMLTWTSWARCSGRWNWSARRVRETTSDVLVRSTSSSRLHPQSISTDCGVPRTRIFVTAGCSCTLHPVPNGATWLSGHGAFQSWRLTGGPAWLVPRDLAPG